MTSVRNKKPMKEPWLFLAVASLSCLFFFLAFKDLSTSTTIIIGKREITDISHPILFYCVVLFKLYFGAAIVGYYLHLKCNKNFITTDSFLDSGSSKGKYKCSRRRVVAINLIGLSSASLLSFFAENTSTWPLTVGRLLFTFTISLIFLLPLILSLYTGKTISEGGIVSIRDNSSSVTQDQIILSHLFYMLIIMMGFKA
jgi:MFS family permease